MTPEEFHQHQIAEHNRGRKPSKSMPLFEAEDGKRIKELEAKLKRLSKASERMRSDLLVRGYTEANGARAVNVSSSTWNEFCDSLDEASSK